MKVYLASDHAGFELKEKIKEYLLLSHEVIDEGALSFSPEDDYPDLISKASLRVSEDKNSFGIVFGKSGTGEVIVANKFKNVRAVLGFSQDNVRLSREHNDSNVLSLGSQFIDFELAKKLTDIFLNTPFSQGERHIRRLKKIEDIENKS